MNDNELIKALECCFVKEDCTECPNGRRCRKDCCDATRKGFAQMGLDLINRQKAEIERLKNHIQEGIDLAKQLPEMVATVKAEAIKEFAERLKEKSNKTELVCSGALVRRDYTIAEKTLDNLLKEMVGDVG